MARTMLDQLQEKEPKYAERGLAYTRSRHEFSRDFLAPDIVQDVVVKFTSLKERTDIEDIYAYFIGTIDREAIRYATRWLRRREHQVEVKDDLTPSSEPTVLDEVYRREEKEEARRKVTRLFEAATSEEREVLQLVQIGLSTSEMAERLHITDSAVRMRIFHLRKRFERGASREGDSPGIPAMAAPAPAPVLVSSRPDSVSCAA